MVIVRAHSNGVFISFLSPSLRQTVLLKSGRFDTVVLISKHSGLVSVKVRLTMFLGSTYFLMSSAERPNMQCRIYYCKILMIGSVLHLDVEERSEELLRQLSYAIKNQLVASKAPY